MMVILSLLVPAARSLHAHLGEARLLAGLAFIALVFLGELGGGFAGLLGFGLELPVVAGESSKNSNFSGYSISSI
jgi:hypothetical protein